MKTGRSVLKTLKLGALALLLGSLTGCVNLTAIKKFAGTAADSANYTTLTTYYLDEFEHQRRYQDEKFYADLDKQSVERHKQEAGLLALHHGVEAYMTAVGQLASDDLVSYDASLNKLAGELKDSKLVTDSKVDAYKDIAASIAKAATDLYRQGKLKKLIDEANAPFQTVVGALKEIVSRGYVMSIDNEAESLKAYYREVIQLSQSTNAQPALTEMVKETWRQKQEDLASRRKACLAYADTLDTIAKGHQELYNNRDKLDAKMTLDTITAYAKSLNDLRSKIKELTK